MAWLLGLGLALLALAFPQERLVGEAFAVGPEHSPLWAIWHRLGGAAGQVLDLPGERVRFVLAGLAYGACLPAAMGLARRLGSPLGPAVLGTSLVLLAPTAWVAGTTPGMTSISLLVSLMLMGALLDPSRRGMWKCLCLWGWLVGTQVSMLPLWPAITLACLPPRNDPAARRRTIAICAFAGLGVAALVVGTNLAQWDPVPLPVALDPSTTSQGFDGDARLRLVSWVPGLGLALSGLAILWTSRRGAHARLRPGWLVAWCAIPAAFLFRGSTLSWDASYQWLLPVVLVGVVSILNQRNPRAVFTLGTLALLAQVSLLLGYQRYVTRTDPLTHWRETTRAFIQPIDTIITGDVRHAYLSSHRWRLRSVILRAAEPEDPSTDRVHGVYISPTGATNLRVKTQDVGAWADEGIEARGFGFRVVLDRPFPGSSKAISEALETALRARVEFWPIDSD